MEVPFIVFGSPLVGREEIDDQVGDYVGEDDIERYDDEYGRG